MVQDPNHSNADNLNNVRCEASRHFRNKKKEYLEVKIHEPETRSNIKNIRHLYRGISDFKDYQPRTNIVEDEKGDLVTDCHSIWLGGGTNSLSCLMYMGLVMLSRQKYIQQDH